MSIRDNTKRSFADAMKSIMHDKELEKIRVKEICQLCGASIPTFYYHFRDKYELVAWIYEQDFRRAASMAGGIYDLKQLENLLAIMQEEEVFYKNAFANAAQNALLPYIRQINIRLARMALSGSKDAFPLSEDQEFTLNFLSHAWNGCLIDWISGENPLSPKEFARRMYQNIQYMNIPVLTEEVWKNTKILK